MSDHHLIVVGASAGGVEAVSSLVAGLPLDLRAAVCVVVHLRPDTQSHLADILARLTPLRVVAARHGMALRPGTVYVAVPDLHLLVEESEGGGVLRLVRGPRENRARPAVDPLFRSAALAFGPRVIGVILSGALDDGTAGLWTVKDRGGIAVVQEPEDAAVPSMPSNALAEVRADHVATARELGPLLGRLARESVASAASAATHREPGDELAREIGITAMSEEAHQASERYGRPSRFACPDCGGVLWDMSDEGPLRFRCEVGHAHSAASLAETQTEAVETAMWTALRALEDKVELARRRGEGAAARGLSVLAEKFAVDEQAAQEHAAALRALLRLDGRTGIRPRLHVEGDDSIPRGPRQPEDAGDTARSADTADAEAGVQAAATPAADRGESSAA
jgi:two-component system chemotaxis response regulator CheB